MAWVSGRWVDNPLKESSVKHLGAEDLGRCVQGPGPWLSQFGIRKCVYSKRNAACVPAWKRKGQTQESRYPHVNSEDHAWIRPKSSGSHKRTTRCCASHPKVILVEFLISGVGVQGEIQCCGTVRCDETGAGRPRGCTMQRLGGCEMREVPKVTSSESKRRQRNSQVLRSRKSCRQSGPVKHMLDLAPSALREPPGPFSPCRCEWLPEAQFRTRANL
jgi:hypothetical protein